MGAAPSGRPVEPGRAIAQTPPTGAPRVSAPPPPPGPAAKPEPKPLTATQRKALATPTYPLPVQEDVDPEGEMAALKATDLVAFNQRAELEFVTIASALLAKNGAMRMREMCIETAKRYLLKHSATIKEFSIEKGWVQARTK
jgi:hypothetical protein